MKPLLLHLHSRPLTVVKFNHDGDLFVTAGKDGLACLVRTEDGERIGTYDGHNGAIYAIDITMNNTMVVTVGADGQVMIFEALTGDCIHRFDHGGILKYVEWNSEPMNQNKIVTCNDKFRSSQGDYKNRIMVWEFDSRNEVCHQALCIDDSSGLSLKAIKAKWGPFDQTIVSIHDEGLVFIWDVCSGELIKELESHTLVVGGVQFSADKMLMVTASKDKSVILWNTEKWEAVKKYETNRPLNDAAISPLYKKTKHFDNIKMHLIMGGGQDAKDVTTSAGVDGQFETLVHHMVFDEEVGSVKGHFGPLNTLAWMPNGMGFVTGGEDGYVRVNHFDPDYLTNRKFD